MTVHDFNDQPIPLGALINGEQLLDFALTYLNEYEGIDEPHGVAEQIVLTYVLNEFHAAGNKSFTEAEIEERYRDLRAEHILAGLAKKGLVEVEITEDGVMYRTNDKARELINGQRKST